MPLFGFKKKKKYEPEFGYPTEEEYGGKVPELPPMPEIKPRLVSPPPLEPLPPLPRIEKPSEAKLASSFPARPMPKVTISAKPKAAPTAPALSKKANVFVRIDKYKNVINIIETIRHELVELDNTLNKIKGLKSKETEIISGWDALLTEAKTKLEEVNSKLFEPEAP